MANKQKRRARLLRSSIMFWISVFVLYAAIFAPLLPSVSSWLTWVKIIVTLLVILLPVGGQIAIIYTYKMRDKKA